MVSALQANRGLPDSRPAVRVARRFLPQRSRQRPTGGNPNRL